MGGVLRCDSGWGATRCGPAGAGGVAAACMLAILVEDVGFSDIVLPYGDSHITFSGVPTCATGNVIWNYGSCPIQVLASGILTVKHEYIDGYAKVMRLFKNGALVTFIEGYTCLFAATFDTGTVPVTTGDMLDVEYTVRTAGPNLPTDCAGLAGFLPIEYYGEKRRAMLSTLWFLSGLDPASTCGLCSAGPGYALAVSAGCPPNFNLSFTWDGTAYSIPMSYRGRRVDWIVNRWDIDGIRDHYGSPPRVSVGQLGVDDSVSGLQAYLFGVFGFTAPRIQDAWRWGHIRCGPATGCRWKPRWW